MEPVCVQTTGRVYLTLFCYRKDKQPKDFKTAVQINYVCLALIGVGLLLRLYSYLTPTSSELVALSYQLEGGVAGGVHDFLNITSRPDLATPDFTIVPSSKLREIDQSLQDHGLSQWHSNQSTRMFDAQKCSLTLIRADSTGHYSTNWIIFLEDKDNAQALLNLKKQIKEIRTKIE